MKNLSFLLISLLMIACSGSVDADENLSDPVAEKQREVIEIHDRVMADMPKLRKMSQRLMREGENRKDSLDLYSHSIEVDLAKDRMMDWMREYKDPVALDMPVEEKLSYLEKEMQKIKDIEEFTNNALEKGEELLTRNGKSAETAN